MRGKWKMIDLNENEIMSEWDVNRYPEPLVAVRCMAYNHEKYISDALDGILRQKTTFPFYIFVHDDCSTDNTANIIKEYEKKYPKIIKAIYEEKNLWSMNNGSLSKVINDNVKAKYEALCEGDDYWIDNLKLEKQISYMEKNPSCSITFTNGKTLDVQTGKYDEVCSLAPGESTYYSQSHVITLKNCAEISFPPTASYVVRLEHKKGIDRVPTCATGDLRMRMYCMTNGYAYYFSDVTCVYRVNVKGSAMTTWKQNINREISFERSMKIVKMLDSIDQLSEYKYSNEIEKIRVIHATNMLLNAKKIKVLSDNYLKTVFKNLSLATKMKIIIKMNIPDVIYNKIKSKMVRRIS